MPTAGDIFFGPNGLRSGWRALAHWILLLVGVAVSAMAVGVAVLGGLQLLGLGPEALDSLWAYLVTTASIALPALLVTLVSAWVLDRASPRGVGLGGPARRSLLELIGGTAVGALWLIPALALVAALGEVRVIGAGMSAGALPEWLGWLVLLLLAASTEELLFRGYGMLWTAEAIGRGAAGLFGRHAGVRRGGRMAVVLLSSAIFGLAHLGNPGAGTISTANTVLAGLWLAVALLRTRALWLPIGLHLGWNLGQALVLGLPVSGLGSEASGVRVPALLETTLAGPSWLIDPIYGIEGSPASSLAVLLAIAVTAAAPRRPDPDAHAALR